MEYLFNDIIYYNVDEIRNLYPSLFTNDKTPTRKLINIFNLSDADYLYAYIKNNNWIISSSSYCKSKLFIKKEWIDNKKNISMVNNNLSTVEFPKILINGIELNIEIKTIGSISIDNILFRVKDIAVEFNTPNLKDTILSKRTLYEENIDYKKLKSNGAVPYLYLTYNGFLRFIFVSRGSKIASELQQWMSLILYKFQFGNQKEKLDIIKTVIPDYANIVTDIFGKFEFPCIYLLGIGEYKNYTNVYKFGRTDNFNRRYKEHNKTYNVICTICILQYIDSDYLSKAETEIKNYMNDINALIQIDNHDELVSLSDKQVKSLINIYKHISQSFSTKTDILQKQIDELKHQMELLIKNNEITILKETHINELLKKDNELLILENKLLKNGL